MLDAPRQHELDAADLRAFVERFYERFSRGPDLVQLVFSATEPSVVPEGCIDSLLRPAFREGDNVHYLGRAAPQAKT